MWASSCALVLAVVAFIVYDMTTYRQALANDLAIRLHVLEINNAAPLAFHDRETARENLAPLRADPRVVASVLYDKDGLVFAQYRRSSEVVLPITGAASGAVGSKNAMDAASADAVVPSIDYVQNFLDLSMPVRLDGEVIGRIALRADLVERNERLRSIALIGMAVLIASCALAFAIASRLQRTISKPIAELTDVAQRVTLREDYAAQATKHGNDEVGRLADGLNAMLTQIHERDLRLQQYSETLERKVAERTEALSRVNDMLSEREARYRHLVDHAHDIICRTDLRGRFLYFNPTAVRLMKYTADELMRRRYVDLVHPTYRRAARRVFRRQTMYRLTSTTSEFPLMAGDGTMLWISQNVQLLMDGERVVGYQAIGRDITERKAVEAALQRAHGELEQLVAARTAELQQTVEQLQQENVERKHAEAALQASQSTIRQMQKMEAIGQLAGGIAHDFNNILTAIVGNAALALDKLAGPDPDDAQVHLRRIMEAGERATGVVQQILTFTRQKEFTRTVLDLTPLVNEVRGLLRATLPAAVELTVTVGAAPPTILADATQLHQVLMNLCTNAWHALCGQPGSIAIELSAVEPTQPVTGLHAVLPPGRYARVSVRDTGCGMTDETIERIFDPFFTTKPVGQGTGLGLSVVHGIMQGHDGAIVVESQLGLGTTFHLYFPAVAAPVPVAPEARDERGLKHEGCRLLYVDDEEMLVELVKNLLGPRGYRVSGYTCAKAAVRVVEADPQAYDIVVTDFNMPAMSGVDLANALMRIRPDLPVVLVSGYLTPEGHEAALVSNIKEIIYKPTMLQEIERVIARLVKAAQEA